MFQIAEEDELGELEREYKEGLLEHLVKTLEDHLKARKNAALQFCLPKIAQGMNYAEALAEYVLLTKPGFEIDIKDEEREIKNEIWYEGERTLRAQCTEDIARITNEWCIKYASAGEAIDGIAMRS